METRMIIQLIGMFALVFMLYISFITLMRTCEVLDKYGNVREVNCSEIGYYEN